VYRGGEGASTGRQSGHGQDARGRESFQRKEREAVYCFLQNAAHSVDPQRLLTTENTEGTEQGLLVPGTFRVPGT